MRKLLAIFILCLASIAAWAQAVTPPGTAALVCAYNTSPPALTSGLFAYVQCDSAGKLITSGGGGGLGTVTSVGETFTGGLISVAGSPITTSGTFALTVAGTSGGIPYFSSASTWASSAALAANSVVLGGGAGAAPSTGGAGTITSLAVGGATLGTSSLAVPAGSAAAPSLAVGNSTTGLYSVSTTGIGLSVNGAAKIDWGATNSGSTTIVGGSGSQVIIPNLTSLSIPTLVSAQDLTSGFAPRTGEADVIISGGRTTIFTSSSTSSSVSITLSTTTTSFNINNDTIFTRHAAANWQLGNIDAASPVAQTLGVQSVVAGTSNTSGQNWTVVGSLATGSGTSGDIIFKTGGSGAGATVQNTATNGLVVKGVTQAVVVSTLAGSGSRPVCVTSTGQLEEGSLSAGLVTCP